MKHTECGDCILKEGDCGNHFKIDGKEIMQMKNRIIRLEFESYTTRPSTGEGIFYYTECGNRLYRTEYNPLKYDRCECPKCGRIMQFKEEYK